VSSNIARYLSQTARENPGGTAIVAPGALPGGLPGSQVEPEPGSRWRRLSFAELDAYSDRIAAGLLRSGIRRGDRCLLMVRAGVELIVITFALFKAGIVPVLIDPGMGRSNFLRSVERSKPTAFIGIPLAQFASVLFPAPFRSVTHRVTVGTRWLWGGDSFAKIIQDTPTFTPVDSASDEVAAVLFTSGSTGPAKGVIYTHGMFDAQVQALKRVFNFQPGEVDLAAFPLFSLFDCALNMTSVIPDLDPAKPGKCNPAKVAEAARVWKCTSASGSPAIWRRVFPWCASQKIQLSHMKRLMTFGAPIPPDLIEVARGVMPNGDVYTPYGATESLPVSCIRGADVLAETAEKTRNGAGTCVGRPDLEVVILGITDEPIGTLDPARILARLRPGQPLEGEAGAIGEIRMGDLAYLDATGRLWFCGRKAERLETATGPLYTDPIEGIFNAWPEIDRCALVGPGARGAQRPVLVVEGPESPELRRKILATQKVADVVFRAALPVDTRHNAKIHRLSLKTELERSHAMVRA
jgi:acyl-CoA synthetase (AMP-forming)/AMP-acid ligase II